MLSRTAIVEPSKEEPVHLKVVLLATLATVSVPALADDMFSLSNGHNLISFELPASPDASLRAGFAFELNNVPVTIDGSTSSDSLIFFDGIAGGGLNITTSGPNSLVLYDPGFQLYETGPYPITSTLFAPTFAPGSFQLRDGAPSLEIDKGAFTVSISPTSVTPEPASSLLLLTGLLSMPIIRKRLRNDCSVTSQPHLWRQKNEVPVA